MQSALGMLKKSEIRGAGVLRVQEQISVEIAPRSLLNPLSFSIT